MRRPGHDSASVDARWIARNPCYRARNQTWTLPTDLDRHGICMCIRALSPKAEARREPARDDDRFAPHVMSNSTRHLMIEGYDRALRRWMLQRARLAVQRLHLAVGMLIATALIGLAGATEGSLMFACLVTLASAAAIALHAMSQIRPLDDAATDAQQWIKNMPRRRAAPRYWRLYESN